MSGTALVIHDEPVPEYRTRLQIFLERFRHRHYAVRRTWTLDDSTWDTDPNAKEYCACGAWRPLWGNWEWMTP